MNKLFKSTLISGFVALGCAAAGPAAAVDSFNGTTWTLTTNGVDLNPSAAIDQFLFTLTVDTSTPDAAVSGSYLDSVSIKVASSVTGNSVTGPAVGPWILQTGGLNNGGCSGSGGGFLCADVTTFTDGALVDGSTYSWVFDISMAHGALFTGIDEASVKGRFTNGNDHHVGAVTSMPITITQVPEPETYAMFLAGLGLMGFMARRRSKNS